jgi:hypothetical protein
MMFTPPRFIVIDDNQQHLEAIVRTFQSMGAPCAGIFFDGTGLDANLFRGVRALFLDLHLLQGPLTSDHKQHYAQIASILEDNIGRDGGPFVLVIWTEFGHLTRELTAFLDARLDPAKPHARPLAVICLEKEKYISLNTGAVEQPRALREAVESAIRDRPQLAALLSWETDVMNATGSTLAALLALVREERRTTDQYPTALNELLSLLAIASVGKSNVPSDRRGAITAALAPLLLDRIYNQSTSAAAKKLWDRAVSLDQQDSLDHLGPLEAGGLNRMLHVALPGPEHLRGFDWGAVVQLPAEWMPDAEMESRFGSRLARILGGDFKIERNDRARCQLRLVRVGAACDYAQGRGGPIPYLLAVEVPVDVRRDEEHLQMAEWRSPVFVVDGPAFRLTVNCRYFVTVPRAQTEGWNVVYRLREQLLMDLIDYAGGYVTRPGIFELRTKNRPEPAAESGKPDSVISKEMGAEPPAPAAGDSISSPEERSQNSSHDGSTDAVAKEPDAVPPSADRQPEPGPASGKGDTAKELCAEPAAPAVGDSISSPEKGSQNSSHDGSTDAVAKEPDAVPPSADRQ